MSTIFTWGRIRRLGELQLFTLISYIVIVFVPILAGSWPIVRSTINEYNLLVNEITQSMELTLSSLKKIEEKIKVEPIKESIIPKSVELNEEIIAILNELKFHISRIKTNFPIELIKNNNLPFSWAMMFFAALSVIGGHLIYQIFSPEIIKEGSRKDHVNKMVKDYLNTRSQDILIEAKTHISPSDINRSDDVDEEVKNIEYIRKAAAIVYDDAGLSKSLARIMCTLMYGGGIIIVLIVLLERSFKIIKVAGWL